MNDVYTHNICCIHTVLYIILCMVQLIVRWPSWQVVFTVCRILVLIISLLLVSNSYKYLAIYSLVSCLLCWVIVSTNYILHTYTDLWFKGSLHNTRFSTSGFFHESVSPGLLCIPKHLWRYSKVTVICWFQQHRQ